MSNLFSAILQVVAGESMAQAVINEGFSEAISTMESMPGNEGQESVLQSYVIPAFYDAVDGATVGDGWPDIDIGDYMDFMGEIVEAGNQIMQEAFDIAAFLESDMEVEVDDDTGDPLEE